MGNENRAMTLAEALSPYTGPVEKGVDTTTLYNKIMCGYQGWFMAEGDGYEPGFVHWGNVGSNPPSATVDLWPDLTEHDNDEKFTTNYKHADGSTARVFSSTVAKTVHRHFKWMKDYGIDGVFIQRFTSQLTNQKDWRYLRTSVVLRHCREGANRYGRAYAVMYDTHFDREAIDAMKADWSRLMKEMKITSDPAYIRHRGAPVISLWGYGFSHRKFDAAATEEFFTFLKQPENGGCTIMLGTPNDWVRWTDDRMRLMEKYATVISPWNVGRYNSIEGAKAHFERNWPADLAWCKARDRDYYAVVFPGFSWTNLQKGKSELNQIPRLGGRFFWSQFEEVKRYGMNMAYVAMFDEVDEGTAIFKCTNNPPVGRFLTYEGYPSDFYLRITGQAGPLLRGQKASFPDTKPDPAQMNYKPISKEVQNVTTVIDWESFLGRHDLQWSKMPTQWYQAPFLGNGMMGTMVRQTGRQTVRWDVGRGDVQNHRRGTDIYGISRLPIGHFELHTAGVITGGDIRLDLWNAEARGTIRTEKGTIQWRSFVHADIMVTVTEIERSEGERSSRWQWTPEEAICPRQLGKPHADYRHNPPFTQSSDGDVQVTVQPLLEGGETVTAWQTLDQDGKTRLTVSVAHSHPETTAQKEAVDVIKRVRGMSTDALTQSHREWWHAYYPISFVSLPDTWWESFYWIQMYKLASGTRADRMLLDLQGPWPQPTPWPACWWNLNIQLTYWPSYTSGRLDVGDSLCRTMYDNVDNLIENVPEPYRSDSAGVARVTGQKLRSSTVSIPGSERAEVGNLLWACHNLWLHYRHTMDDERLRQHLFPLLKRAVNFHLHFLQEEEDGKLHLPKTYSPEYNSAEGPDCNYDLALLRWGCTALIQACERLEIDDPLLPKWTEVLEKLVDYPKDNNGYMIARSVPFARGHRHFSHLLMNYPLYLVNVDQPGAKEVAVKSVRHWQGLGGRQGYSLAGASSISSAYGLGNDSLAYLDGLKPFIQANTMYKEAGPVIETPLFGAQSIHDMLLQGWGGTIRVFPAVADAWSDVVFHDLRTEGAFLVSAERKNGKTVFVRIKSLKGEPCIIMPAIEGQLQVSGNRTFKLKQLEPGRYALDLKPGEEAVLWSGDQMPDLTLSPIPAEPGKSNAFGLRDA